MVRTKADRVPTKAVGSKAPNKSVRGTPSKKASGGGSKGKSYSGGNPYHPRDTPDWQKPITSFLSQNSAGESAHVDPLNSKENEEENAEGEVEDETD